MLLFWRWGLCAVVLTGITGCETAPESQAPLLAVSVPEPLPIAPAAPLETPVTTYAQGNTPAPSSTPAPIALMSRPVWPSNWVNAWIPLESWGKFNGLGNPQQVSATPTQVYQFNKSNNTVSVRVGSRIAYCDGLECWLGHAPQLIHGLPYIHSLDAQKTFQPLVNLAVRHFRADRTIVLDPGHGGKDSGTKSCFNGCFEKDYTLDLALRLRRLLNSEGWRVLLTRTNDTDVSLTDRVAAAERANADCFLSLHFNSGQSNHELEGVETYCLTPAGLPSNLVRNYDDDVTQVFPNNAFDEMNLQFAFQLHRVLVQFLGTPDRGVRRARFMGVLRGQNRPAALVEAGYLSNPREAEKIATSEYRQLLAETVAKALD